MRMAGRQQDLCDVKIYRVRLLRLNSMESFVEAAQHASAFANIIALIITKIRLE